MPAELLHPSARRYLPPAERARPGVRVLVIDNYDSFTYNLVQLFLSLGANVRTYRNDLISVTQAEKLIPTHLVISPGPGGPREAGISMKMIEHYAGKTVDLQDDSLIALISGNTDKLDAAMRLLSKFDIVETVRTGKVVMARGLADT